MLAIVDGDDMIGPRWVIIDYIGLRWLIACIWLMHTLFL